MLYTRVLTLASSSSERNVTVWRPSVRLSVCVCPVFLLTLIERAAHTQRDSPGGSMRRGQRTFWPDNMEDRHNCFSLQ